MAQDMPDVQKPDIQIVDEQPHLETVRSIRQRRKATMRGFGLRLTWESEMVSSPSGGCDDDG